MKLLLFLILCLPVTAFAIDGTVSVEHDFVRSSWARDWDHTALDLHIIDTQMNVGKTVGDYRYYVNLEYTFDNTVSPEHHYRDSFIDYRIGTIYTLGKNLQVDAGIGCYGYQNNMNEHNVPYFHSKLTYSFSTE